MLTAVHVKNCRVCEKQFAPFSSTQVVCGLKCAQKIPSITKRAVMAAHKARIIALKPLGHWRNELQKDFNAYIRARDAEFACISCGRFHMGQWHAGHYLSTGARPELRFDESNCHKQCQPCNTHLHGNLVLYRIALLAKVGSVEVARLEGPHEPKKYTADQLKAMAAEYRSKTRALLKDRDV